MIYKINPLFNQHLLGIRPVPKTPEGLAERIIAQAAMSASQGNLLVMLVLPRPYMIMSILFLLSLLAGAGLDMGFNSMESLDMSEQDILYSFDEEVL